MGADGWPTVGDDTTGWGGWRCGRVHCGELSLESSVALRAAQTCLGTPRDCELIGTAIALRMLETWRPIHESGLVDREGCVLIVGWANGA